MFPPETRVPAFLTEREREKGKRERLRKRIMKMILVSPGKFSFTFYVLFKNEW